MTKYSKQERAWLKAIGSNIRKLRQQKGFSQENFAFECDLDRTYIGGIERGERNLAAINIIRIAKVLKVAPGTIFENAGE